MSGGLAKHLLELTEAGVPVTLKSKTIRDPIHGYIRTTKAEKMIIDLPIFQRLKRLHQLQTAFHVYPGAEHSRFQHSIGVMHLAGKFAVAILKRTYELSGQERETVRIPTLKELGIEEREELISALLAVRIAGLLHDIGHGPYSHAFDEAIISRSQELKKRGIESHEDVGYFIFSNHILGCLDAVRREIDEVADYDLMVSFVEAILLPRKVFNERKRKLKPIAQILRLLIREFVYPADIIDFVLRDSYFTGVREYGMVDAERLMSYSVIISATEGEFKPSLEIGLLDTALNAFRAFLMSRFLLFNNVYYHRFSRIMDFSVQKLLRLLNEGEIIDFIGAILKIREQDDTSDYELLDDYYVLYKAIEAGGEVRRIAYNIMSRIPEYAEAFDQEFLSTRQERLRKHEIHCPERVISEIYEAVKEVIETHLGREIPEDAIYVDTPMVRFFPDNPFLPKRNFKVVKVRRDQLVDQAAYGVRDIGISVNTTLFRIFLLRNLEKELSERMGHESLREEIRRVLEERGLLEKMRFAFISKMEKEVGVTM